MFVEKSLRSQRRCLLLQLRLRHNEQTIGRCFIFTRQQQTTVLCTRMRVILTKACEQWSECRRSSMNSIVESERSCADYEYLVFGVYTSRLMCTQFMYVRVKSRRAANVTDYVILFQASRLYLGL